MKVTTSLLIVLISFRRLVSIHMATLCFMVEIATINRQACEVREYECSYVTSLEGFQVEVIGRFQLIRL